MDCEAWKGRSGVLVRNLSSVRVVYWVNVSESSGAGSPEMSWKTAVKWLLLDNGCWIMPSNSPGGSTLHCDVVRISSACHHAL